MEHLENNNIFCDRPHGFRSKLSCETQLLLFQQELLEVVEKGSQTDVIIMDFSKAFDKVPHRRLMGRIRYYQVASWIQCFLSGRRQWVVVDGVESAFTEVLSGVPQGTVLGPVLFPMFIKDLPDDIKSNARLFTDYCVLSYHQTPEDRAILQQDVDILAHRELTWQMEFNPGKCCVMHVTRSRTLHLAPYLLRGHQLEVFNEAKYLGVLSRTTYLGPLISWTQQ